MTSSPLTEAEQRLLTHFIDGSPDETVPPSYTEVTDSATGAVVARVPHATEAVVDRAVASARAAAAGWAATSLSKRTEILFAVRELMHSRRDQLAEVVTQEHGKALDDAAGEVKRGLEVVELACGLANLLKGEMSAQISRSVDAYSMRRPLGVVAGITPFNFPVMVPMWMAPVAIACGNCFVLKPSDQDPTASLLVAEMFSEAGLPDGVFNVVHGDKIAVEALLGHPEVAAVSFVGSTPVAQHVYATATAHGKRAQALGGAKNHAVVLPDADLPATADALTSAGYGSAGQRCMAVSVTVAVGAIADPLIEALLERIDQLRVGDGRDPSTQMGPLVSSRHLERVRSYVDAGVGEGAELVADGRAIEVPGGERGHFLGPCLFDRVQPGMKIYDEEIFGPVLLVVRAKTYTEAISLVNASPYGNGAAIFTRDGGAARIFEQDVEAGMVGVNVPIPVPMAYYSFGGWKHSLFGDLHVHGAEGVRFFTRGKVVTRRWSDPSNRGVDLGFPTSS